MRCGRRLLLLTLGLSAPTAPAGAESRTPLADGWTLQSSAKVGGAGRGRVPARLRDRRAGTRVTVPNTVVGALVENGTYPDPYFGMNLRSIPGTTYPIGRALHAAADARRQPVQARLVVPHGVRRCPRARRPQPGAALRRHQLPRERLAQRHARRLARRGGRRLPPLRVRRHAPGAAGRDQRARRRGHRPGAARPGDHVGRLEPDARRQEHGPLGRRLPHRQRPAGAARPARGDRPRPAVPRARAS